MMDPPAALLAALPVRADLEAAAQLGGWPYLTHGSCLHGVRTFIAVTDPQDRFDQWLLLGVDPAEPALAEQTVLSFMALQKRTTAGALLDPPRIHFRDYVLSRNEQAWQLELPETKDGKCYACHGSGPRQLLAFPEAVTAAAPVRGDPEFGEPVDAAAFAQQRLDSFNQRLLGYRVSDFHTSINVDDLGPPLGSALGCTHCHDGVTRGPLTVFTSETMLHQKVVEQLSMRGFSGAQQVPDRPAMDLLDQERRGEIPLSPEEERTLAEARAQHQADFNVLLASRLPDLKAWLLDKPCQ